MLLNLGVIKENVDKTRLFVPPDIYRTNMFHLAVGGCALVLQKDLEYWGIDELMMEPCCALKYYPEIEICHNEKQVINRSGKIDDRGRF